MGRELLERADEGARGNDGGGGASPTPGKQTQVARLPAGAPSGVASVAGNPVADQIASADSAAPLLDSPISAAAADAPATVPTTWFVDFWGVGDDGKKAGRGERHPGDAMMLQHFKVGPKSHAKSFEKAGNALPSGYSQVGTYDHPAGPGSASATVMYGSLNQIDVDLGWSDGPHAKITPDAIAAAKLKVQELITSGDGNNGDWSTIEQRASEAAAAELEGAAPNVHIYFKSHPTAQTLQTVDYDVHEPSACTAEVRVPTKTTATNWSVSNTTHHEKGDGNASGGAAHVGTDVGADSRHKDGVSSGSVGVKTDAHVDATVDHSSKNSETYRHYGVTWDEIDHAASDIASTVLVSFDATWEKMISALVQSKDGGTVTTEAEHHVGLGERVKNWFKERGKDVVDFVSGKVVDKVGDVLKSRLTKWVVRGIEAETWYIPIIGWGIDHAIDWAGDKLKTKLKIDRGPAAPDKHDHQFTPQNTITMHALYESVRVTTTSIKADITKLTHGHIDGLVRTYEQSTHDATKVGSSSKTTVDARQSGSANDSGAHANVHTDVGAGSAHQDSKRDEDTTTRTYSGTTIKVVAGHPVLDVKIEPGG
jgi:hypothetical protein